RQLLEVVGALSPRRCLAHLLHGWNQKGDQDGDDGDHHQELNEGEPISWPGLRGHKNSIKMKTDFAKSLTDKKVSRKTVPLVIVKICRIDVTFAEFRMHGRFSLLALCLLVPSFARGNE